jgi:dTDP-glucose 4,6-dehydratase
VMVTNLIEGRKVPVYGRGENVRDWLHVEDCCRAIELVLNSGRPGEAYNIGGESERRNIDVVRLVIEMMGMTGDRRPQTDDREPGTRNQELATNEFFEFVSDRPGHDFRYALDNTKIEHELGWRPETSFEDGLRRTVDWYREHPDWWRPLKERLTRESAGFWTGNKGDRGPETEDRRLETKDHERQTTNQAPRTKDEVTKDKAE